MSTQLPGEAVRPRPFQRLQNSLLPVIVAVATSLAGPGAVRAQVQPPSPAAHTFNITYRSFGPVAVTSAFQDAGAILVRFEGCYAKDGPEAICGFTVRAKERVVVSNLGNGSHGVRTDGSPMRTCCLFEQGRPEGFPIVATAEGGADLAATLQPGEERGFMLRLPDYRAGPPLRSIAFARGRGASAIIFAADVRQLP